MHQSEPGLNTDRGTMETGADLVLCEPTKPLNVRQIQMGCRAPVAVIPALASGRHFVKSADCWRVHAVYEVTGANPAGSS